MDTKLDKVAVELTADQVARSAEVVAEDTEQSALVRIARPTSKDDIPWDDQTEVCVILWESIKGSRWRFAGMATAIGGVHLFRGEELKETQVQFRFPDEQFRDAIAADRDKVMVERLGLTSKATDEEAAAACDKNGLWAEAAILRGQPVERKLRVDVVTNGGQVLTDVSVDLG